MKRLALAVGMVLAFPLSLVLGALIGAGAFALGHWRAALDLFRSPS